jgi:hypothetical protein
LERPESNNCFRDVLLENKWIKAGKPAKVIVLCVYYLVYFLVNEKGNTIYWVHK